MATVGGMPVACTGTPARAGVPWLRVRRSRLHGPRNRPVTFCEYGPSWLPPPGVAVPGRGQASCRALRQAVRIRNGPTPCARHHETSRQPKRSRERQRESGIRNIGVRVPEAGMLPVLVPDYWATHSWCRVPAGYPIAAQPGRATGAGRGRRMVPARRSSPLPWVSLRDTSTTDGALPLDMRGRVLTASTPSAD